MAVLHIVCRLLRLCPDLAENANTGLEIALRNILDEFFAQIVRGIENFIQDGLRTPLQMDDLAAPIKRGTATLDPRVVLQTIQQTSQGGPLNSPPLGDFLLGKLVSTEREMNQRAPFALAKPEGPQALIQLRPPGPRRAEKHETQFIDVWWRHGWKNWLAC